MLVTCAISCCLLLMRFAENELMPCPMLAFDMSVHGIVAARRQQLPASRALAHDLAESMPYPCCQPNDHVLADQSSSQPEVLTVDCPSGPDMRRPPPEGHKPATHLTSQYTDIFTGQLNRLPVGCITCGSRAPSDGNTSSQSGRPNSSGVRVAARFRVLPVVSLHMAVSCPVLVRRTEAVGRLTCSRCRQWEGVVVMWCLLCV